MKSICIEDKNREYSDIEALEIAEKEHGVDMENMKYIEYEEIPGRHIIHTTEDREEIKRNIERLAKEESMEIIECISMLQAAAALLDDDEKTLDQLSDIKNDYIKEKYPHLSDLV